jgi:hypothetical protein
MITYKDFLMIRDLQGEMSLQTQIFILPLLKFIKNGNDKEIEILRQ